VEAQAVNLNNQLRQIPMRETKEQGAIYYLGELTVAHAETLTFTIEVTPAGQDKTQKVQFQQEFFTE
jgi:hypothetical protein